MLPWIQKRLRWFHTIQMFAVIGITTKKLKKRFANIYKFSITEKRCLPIWIHGWLSKIQYNIISETDFYSHLNMEYITCTQKEFKKIFKQNIWLNIMICIFKAIQYCYWLHLTTFRKRVLKYMGLILLTFVLRHD